jgi:hypothetical protein
MGDGGAKWGKVENIVDKIPLSYLASLLPGRMNEGKDSDVSGRI